jgi:glutathione S-transferase
LAEHLEKNKWFVGDELTAADIQMSYAVEALESRSKDMTISPTIGALAQRMRERPAYQRALAKGGPVIPD